MSKDKNIRELFSETKIEASENLKYRIMQQIVTEKSLVSKKRKRINTPNQVFIIFGIICVLATCLGVYFYDMSGQYEAQVSPLILLAFSVIGIGSIFGSILVFDEYRRNKRRN